jgi:ribosomal protein L39E
MRALTIALTRQVVLIEEKKIQYKKKKTNNRVPFVIIYHPALSKLSNIVRKHWTTIQKHP